MFDQELIFRVLGLTVIGAPAALFCVLGLTSLRGRPLSERSTVMCVQTAITARLLASIAILAMMLGLGTRHVPIPLGHWVSIPHYHFVFKFEFDRLSVPFVILT